MKKVSGVENLNRLFCYISITVNTLYSWQKTLTVMILTEA